MNCQCCGLQKSRVGPKDSKLVKGNKLLLCTTCKRDDHEPRYIIIIAAHSGKDIKNYIRPSRYCGDELTAADVIV